MNLYFLHKIFWTTGNCRKWFLSFRWVKGQVLIPFLPILPSTLIFRIYCRSLACASVLWHLLPMDTSVSYCAVAWFVCSFPRKALPIIDECCWNSQSSSHVIFFPFPRLLSSISKFQSVAKGAHLPKSQLCGPVRINIECTLTWDCVEWFFFFFFLQKIAFIPSIRMSSFQFIFAHLIFNCSCCSANVEMPLSWGGVQVWGLNILHCIWSFQSNFRWSHMLVVCCNYSLICSICNVCQSYGPHKLIQWFVLLIEFKQKKKKGGLD